MKRKIMMILAFIFICGLSGCGNTTALSQYDTDEIWYIAYTDIDTVCDSHELTVVGADILSSVEEHLLLSFVVDSSIGMTDELGDYDHLILTNPQWIERFGDPDRLKPVEYDSLPDGMQRFLEDQIPLWTVDGSILPDGMGLYEYEGEKLLAFPVYVTLGGAEPIEAENPLIILVDKPAQTLKAGSCMLPLTSSGNVLFTDGDEIQKTFEESSLTDYGAVRAFGK